MTASPGWLAAIVGGVGAAAGAIGAWFAARRKTSGSVETSEAADLWAEGAALRQSLSDEVTRMRGELTALRADGEAARVAARAAEEAARAAERAAADAKAETEEWKAKAAELAIQVRTLNDEVFGLRRQLQQAGAELEDIHRQKTDLDGKT